MGSLHIYGNACLWYARDGTDATGDIIAACETEATIDETVSAVFPAGITFTTGLFLDLASGAGSCYATYGGK